MPKPKAKIHALEDAQILFDHRKNINYKLLNYATDVIIAR
jgi:hypothetical protein